MHFIIKISKVLERKVVCLLLVGCLTLWYTAVVERAMIKVDETLLL